ncbi:MAG: polyphosphate polymerase domain-containing protein [Oscillospiraceae bacterium]|jgi:SPX domain protein involved in polyphosphate accumulation|nr:polyphosphate polymerase domain-containing protein [Oscillospiraceae bacterium]
MAIEVFNRYENKYLLDERTYSLLRDRFEATMELDAYNKAFETYPISNLYYDTTDNYLIRASLSKPRYKEKVRIRAYGVPASDGKVYAEIKKKVGGLVNKRRTALTLTDAYTFLKTAQPPELQPCMNAQVLSELQYIAATRELLPTAYLAYDRRAYFGGGDCGGGTDDLRVSFDANIRSRRYDLRLEAGDYGEQLLGGGQYIMEIKVARAIPPWLCRLLSECKVYPQSFSKYGEEYKKRLRENLPLAAAM